MDAPDDRAGPAPARGLEVVRYLISVLAAALMLGVLAMPGSMPWVAAAVLPMSLGYALIVAFPVALVVRATRRMTPLVAVLTGAAVGAFPMGLFGLASSGVLGFLFFTIVGAAAGVVAWLVLRLQELPDMLLRGRRPVLASLGGSAAVVGLAIAGAAGALNLMNGPRDLTCHNMFRDGRRSISPVISAELELPEADGPKMRRLLAEAGAAGAWSVRDLSRETDAAHSVAVSLCKPAGTVISVHQLIWKERSQSAFERSMSVGVYQPQGGGDWVEPSRSVLQRISASWPGHLKFKRPNGAYAPPPDWYCADRSGRDAALCPAGHPDATAKADDDPTS